MNGTLFFTAFDNENGTELWKSDGTSEGTVLFNDINPGSGSSFPRDLTYINDTLFFLAFANGQGLELWKINIQQDFLTGTISNGQIVGFDSIAILFEMGESFFMNHGDTEDTEIRKKREFLSSDLGLL
ncbi:MAG: ELWxxDGT repeat protein [Xenococcus sp. (in: cyanobacteria)]